MDGGIGSQIIVMQNLHSMDFITLEPPQASHGSLEAVTREMFKSETFDKLKDVAATVGTLKCQPPIVLHFCVNSGQINSLKDKIIIHGFNKSKLMLGL